MKCPSCGYISFDRVPVCGNCGASLAPDAPLPMQMPLPLAAGSGGAEPGVAVGPAASVTAESPAGASRSRGGKKRSRQSRSSLPKSEEPELPLAGSARAEGPDEALVVDATDLEAQSAPCVPHPPQGAVPVLEVPLKKCEVAPVAAPFAPAPRSLPEAETPDVPAESPPIINRPEEIPERFWAPEGAGFVRRAVALLADQALQAALLGLFAIGAALALVRDGIEVTALLSWPGLRAALPPLVLLAVLLSFVYHVPCHAVSGGTPGQRLAGLEVRCRDGSAPTWARAALRWCGGALGLACGGVGIVWALFEPRRRGWADFVSDTLIVERVPEDPGRTL